MRRLLPAFMLSIDRNQIIKMTDPATGQKTYQAVVSPSYIAIPKNLLLRAKFSRHRDAAEYRERFYERFNRLYRGQSNALDG